MIVFECAPPTCVIAHRLPALSATLQRPTVHSVSFKEPSFTLHAVFNLIVVCAPVSFRVARDQATTPVAARPATAATASPADADAVCTSGATAEFMACRK